MSAQRSQAGLTFAAYPPDHGRYRGLVSRAVTPRTVRDMEPIIRDIVWAALDRLPVGDPVDVVEAISIPVSLNVIAAMLGVPGEDWEQFRRATDSFVEVADAVPGSAEAARMQAAVAEFLEYLERQLALRRAEPRNDLMTAITVAELDGERLSAPLQVQFCFNLLVAGNATTRNPLSAAAVAFAEHPDQWPKVVANRRVAESATEELSARFGGLEPAGGVVRVASTVVDRYATVPVRFTGA